MAKLLPTALNSSHYRFPAQGHSYIEIPQEAFRSHGGCLGPGVGVHPGLPGSRSVLEARGAPWGVPGSCLIT